MIINTPDKDLAQCLQGVRIVQFDRRRRIERDHDGVVQKFGVEPKSIPYYFALVGDAARRLFRSTWMGRQVCVCRTGAFGCLEAIPPTPQDWHVNVTNAQNLSQTLNSKRDLVYLLRDLATLRTNFPLFESVENLLWQGPAPAFAPLTCVFRKPSALKSDHRHLGLRRRIHARPIPFGCVEM